MARSKRSAYRVTVGYKWTRGGWYKREFGLALHLINLSYSRGLVSSPSRPTFTSSPIRLFRRVLKDSPGSELSSPSASASGRGLAFPGEKY